MADGEFRWDKSRAIIGEGERDVCVNGSLRNK